MYPYLIKDKNKTTTKNGWTKDLQFFYCIGSILKKRCWSVAYEKDAPVYVYVQTLLKKDLGFK